MLMSEFLPVTITTERLTLRHIEARDAADYFTIFSDPEVTRYYAFACWTDMTQATDEIATILQGYRSGESLRFAIERRDSGAMIGTISLHHFFAQNRRCEMGYALASAHWGHGFIGEAMQAAIDHGFKELDLNRIEADIDPRNIASGKALERVGFKKEGYMPERWIVNGEVCDTEFYGLLRSTWEAR